jgi:hypothetical protein
MSHHSELGVGGCFVQVATAFERIAVLEHPNGGQPKAR